MQRVKKLLYNLRRRLRNRPSRKKNSKRPWKLPESLSRRGIHTFTPSWTAKLRAGNRSICKHHRAKFRARYWVRIRSQTSQTSCTPLMVPEELWSRAMMSCHRRRSCAKVRVAVPWETSTQKGTKWSRSSSKRSWNRGRSSRSGPPTKSTTPTKIMI